MIAIVIPVPVSPSDRPGFTGPLPFSPVTLIVPPVACAIMSNARLVSYGLPVPKPFTWQ